MQEATGHLADWITLFQHWQEDNQGTPEGLVFAILCDFKGRPEREVLHYIVQRLRQLAAENEAQFREYVRMLEVLSTNRSLEHIIEEEEKMLSQVDQTRLPSFRIEMQQGMQREARTMLEQLNHRVDRILDAPTLSAVFDGH